MVQVQMEPATEGPVGRILSVRRALAALLSGAAIAAVVAAATGEIELLPLVLWNAASILLVGRIWMLAWPLDSEGTKRIAEIDARRPATDTAVLAATFASIAAVIAALVEASGRKDAVSVAMIVLSVVAILMSWAMVNTVFALKYAWLYYLGIDGGIDFKQPEPPTYVDFAYMAFTVGVSFAVSETEPNSTAMRKLVLPHAVLGYAYTTLMVAVVINLMTNIG
jgi:uncharacterized membrane protein